MRVTHRRYEPAIYISTCTDLSNYEHSEILSCSSTQHTLNLISRDTAHCQYSVALCSLHLEQSLIPIRSLQEISCPSVCFILEITLFFLALLSGARSHIGAQG
jgi:hypothetical protein